MKLLTMRTKVEKKNIIIYTNMQLMLCIPFDVILFTVFAAGSFFVSGSVGEDARGDGDGREAAQTAAQDARSSVELVVVQPAAPGKIQSQVALGHAGRCRRARGVSRLRASAARHSRRLSANLGKCQRQVSLDLCRPPRRTGNSPSATPLPISLKRWQTTNCRHLSSLDFTINRFFMKLFQTNSIEILRTCQESFGFELPSVLR